MAAKQDPVDDVLSLTPFLSAFFRVCGGPAAAGEIAANIYMDTDINTQVRVRVLEIVTRLTGQFGDDDSGDALDDPELLEAEIARYAGK